MMRIGRPRTVLHATGWAVRANQFGRLAALVLFGVFGLSLLFSPIAEHISRPLVRLEDFIHRVGRTGRAGARGSSWTFATPLERSDIRGIEKMLNVRIEYQDVPSLPAPIGMVPEDGIIVRTAAVSAPTAMVLPPTRKVRSFSPGRRGRR